jgi:hypothetical protein
MPFIFHHKVQQPIQKWTSSYPWQTTSKSSEPLEINVTSYSTHSLSILQCDRDWQRSGVTLRGSETHDFTRCDSLTFTRVSIRNAFQNWSAHPHLASFLWVLLNSQSLLRVTCQPLFLNSPKSWTIRHSRGQQRTPRKRRHIKIWNSRAILENRFRKIRAVHETTVADGSNWWRNTNRLKWWTIFKCRKTKNRDFTTTFKCQNRKIRAIHETRLGNGFNRW